jgi:hypothetical protein
MKRYEIEHAHRVLVALYVEIQAYHYTTTFLLYDDAERPQISGTVENWGEC